MESKIYVSFFSSTSIICFHILIVQSLKKKPQQNFFIWRWRDHSMKTLKMKSQLQISVQNLIYISDGRWQLWDDCAKFQVIQGRVYLCRSCSISNLSSEQISKRKHEKLANQIEEQRGWKMFSQRQLFTTTDCLWWGWNALHNGLITSHSWLCHKFVVVVAEKTKRKYG